jgi:nucleoside-diphosphate-sugar epimerase
MVLTSVFDLVKTQISNETLDDLRSFYKDKQVLVTGGASFIGSNLVELLISLGSKISVVDDFSSGKLQNLYNLSPIKIIEGDLRSREFSLNALKNTDVVFHLAAVHGGRGFIETYKQEMLVNLAIDNNVFAAGVSNGVSMMVHASSACAYPVNLQEDQSDRHLLHEGQASMDSPDTSFADGVYGWTKLIGEYQLLNHTSHTGMSGRSARIFTAYGERENESHAAIALIAKALLKADPYPIWGNGQQTRNFTHVGDTALGLLILGADDSSYPFDVFNIGTSHHIKVIDFVNEIFSQLDWKPRDIDFQLDRPTGVASRASDNSKIFDRFGWQPQIGIEIGVERTLSWYRGLDDRPRSLMDLEQRLASR